MIANMNRERERERAREREREREKESMLKVRFDTLIMAMTIKIWRYIQEISIMFPGKTVILKEYKRFDTNH